MNIAEFAWAVISLRLKWPFSVSSWGRTIQHNKDVGGVDGSDHLLWLGVDVVFDEMKKSLEFEKDCARVGLIALFEKSHYHLRAVG